MKVNLADAVRDTLSSPNEVDAMMETANVVDGLFAIARAIRFLGNTLERAMTEAKVGDALDGVAALGAAVDRMSRREDEEP